VQAAVACKQPTIPSGNVEELPCISTDRTVDYVVKHDNIVLYMTRNSRLVSWIKAARKDFEGFPMGAQTDMARALTRSN
jgi:hypothetical protein